MRAPQDEGGTYSTHERRLNPGQRCSSSATAQIGLPCCHLPDRDQPSAAIAFQEQQASPRGQSWRGRRRSVTFGRRNVMKLLRRHFLHLAAGAAALSAVPRTARPQAYPARPVRLTGFGPGRRLARHRRTLIGQWLSERLGQPFVVGDPAGRQRQYRAPRRWCARPRTATRSSSLMSANAINASVYDNLRFNFIRDTVPVASIGTHSPGHGGQSVGSGEDGSRVHRLCQGQSGQDQHGVGRQRARRCTSPASCSR